MTDYHEIPELLSSVVADEEARERFGRLNKTARKAIIAGARGLSREELKHYLKQQLAP